MSVRPEALNAALTDRYRIERELGQGGMATVYLAQDLRHDRKVAIKVLKPELAAVLGAERFVVEIKTTAAMSHPHILPLFDSGTADGFLFYVMPYIQGETIREKLNRETQFGVDEAVRIAREVASALDYAHRHGVIHRDIKPENILLHDGSPMVMDFGIALAVSAAAGGRMTETGLSLGTPHYMSPEQATADKDLTARSDIYSLASVLYEMLTGDPPFTASSAQAVIMKIITDTPRPVNELRRNVPPNVAAALARALEKMPADRFESAKAFADALGNSGFTVAGARPATTVRQTRWPLASGAVAAMVVMVAGGFALGRSSVPNAEPPHVEFALELPDSITSISRCCGPTLALSPDGRIIVFTGTKSGEGSLYRRRVNQLAAEAIPGTEDGSSPSFSPNGDWLLFWAKGMLRKVPMAGGPVLPIATTTNVSGATWADNDTVIFTRQAGNQLYTVPAAGGQPRKVPVPDSLLRAMYPAALPGGRYVLAALRRSGAPLEESRIGTVDLATGRADTLGFGTRAVLANGSLIVSTSNNTLLEQAFHADSRLVRGEATVMLTGVALSGSSNHEFAVSQNGWLSYEVGLSAVDTLIVVSRESTTVMRFPNRPTPDIEDPAISPDGTRILMRFTGATNLNDLWMYDRRQRTLTRFTVGGALSPAWSPDGRQVAYYAPSATDSTNAGIYVRWADRDETPRLVWRGRNVYPNSWTPDSRSIAFNTNFQSRGEFDIGVVTVGDTAVRWFLQSEFTDRQPQISPNGRWLAYGSNRTGMNEIYVQSFPSGGLPTQISTAGGTSPRWSRDGKTLYFISSNSIVAASITSGPSIGVTKRETIASGLSLDGNAANSNWDVFPDGKLLLVDLGGGKGRPRIGVIQNWPALARSIGTSR